MYLSSHETRSTLLDQNRIATGRGKFNKQLLSKNIAVSVDVAFRISPSARTHGRDCFCDAASSITNTFANICEQEEPHPRSPYRLDSTVGFQNEITLDFVIVVACETRRRHIADLRHVDKAIVERRLVSDGRPMCGCNSVPSGNATSATVLPTPLYVSWLVLQDFRIFICRINRLVRDRS